MCVWVTITNIEIYKEKYNGANHIFIKKNGEIVSNGSKDSVKDPCL